MILAVIAAAIIIAVAFRRALHVPISSWLLITLLLAAASITAYTLTWRRAHEFTSSTSDSTRFTAIINGRLVTMHLIGLKRTPGLTHTTYTLNHNLDSRWDLPDTARRYSITLPGVMRDDGTVLAPQTKNGYPYKLLSIPLWPVLVLCILPFLLALLPPIRRRLRKRRGLCPNCAFDLRASPHLCPECGHRAAT
jgi:hypothetical protein